ADDDRGHDPRRAAALAHADALEATLHEPGEPARGAAHAHADRTPAVLGRHVVVRVLDRLQPRLRLAAEERVLDVLGAPAGGGEEVRDDRLALVGDDLAARRVDRLVRRGGLGRDAAVDL